MDYPSAATQEDDIEMAEIEPRPLSAEGSINGAVASSKAAVSCKSLVCPGAVSAAPAEAREDTSNITPAQKTLNKPPPATKTPLISHSNDETTSSHPQPVQPLVHPLPCPLPLVPSPADERPAVNQSCYTGERQTWLFGPTACTDRTGLVGVF